MRFIQEATSKKRKEIIARGTKNPRTRWIDRDARRSESTAQNAAWREPQFKNLTALSPVTDLEQSQRASATLRGNTIRHDRERDRQTHAGRQQGDVILYWAYCQRSRCSTPTSLAVAQHSSRFNCLSGLGTNNMGSRTIDRRRGVVQNIRRHQQTNGAVAL